MFAIMCIFEILGCETNQSFKNMRLLMGNSYFLTNLAPIPRTYFIILPILSSRLQNDQKRNMYSEVS